MEFLSDWKFWSFLVALTALILSQLPPVHQMLKKPAVTVEAFEQIQVTQELGYPAAMLHVIVANDGGRDVRVRKIEIDFRREQTSRMLPGRGYYKDSGDKLAVILASFRVPVGEEWGHIVNFFVRPTGAEHREVEILRGQFRNDIVTKRRALDDKTQDVNVADNLLDRAMHLHDANFFWLAGEYDITLKITIEPAEASVTRKYRMTLFESDAADLRSSREKLAVGAGFLFPDAAARIVFTPLIAA